MHRISNHLNMQSGGNKPFTVASVFLFISSVNLMKNLRTKIKRFFLLYYRNKILLNMFYKPVQQILLWLLQYSYIYYTFWHCSGENWGRNHENNAKTRNISKLINFSFLLILVWNMNWHVLNGFHEIHSIMWNKTQHKSNPTLPGNTSSTAGNYMIIYDWYVSGGFHYNPQSNRSSTSENVTDCPVTLLFPEKLIL